MLFTMEKIKILRRSMLEISLKSLASSRKNIDVIHLYGHCISCTGIEELEIEITYTSVQKLSVCPELIKNSPHQ